MREQPICVNSRVRFIHHSRYSGKVQELRLV